MTPEQLVSEITKIYGFLAVDEQETLLELIEQFKSKWEAESYIKGFKDACNKTKEYLNAPEP